jgi:hypothetical protein
VFVTSLVSLADLAALLPAELARTPRILYMHENQAAYPSAAGRGDPRDAHAAATNLMSMLAADLILWNSRWNRDSFLQQMEDMLRRGHAPVQRDVLGEVADRSVIAWPPVETPEATDSEVLHNASEAKARGLTLVAWPHRWEHDKGPDALLAIERDRGAALGIGWVLLGEQFEQSPPEMAALIAHAGDRVVHAGWASRGAYETWLHACDWVLSTARHEFFGIAVVEALLTGCLPWLPNRLSYPELVPPEDLGLTPEAPPGDPQRRVAAIREHLKAATAPEATRRIEAHVAATASRGGLAGR